MKYTLVTGASGGIGEALAIKLAKKKHNLVLVARNAEKLSKLSKQLQETYGVQAAYIAADLAKQEAPFQIFQETRRQNWEIDMLVNNAGIGSGGEFATLNLQSELDLMQLNNASLVAMTHLFMQPMRDRKSGTIINVASLAAFAPVPYMATYAASKVFVRSFTEAITEECKPYNIQVMLFAPGLTKTNFNEAAGINNEKGAGLNADYQTAATQTPDEVADELLQALNTKKHFHVSGSRNRLGSRIVALLPNAMITRFMAKSYQKKLALL
ncbi:SDR family oxidoreductase [Dyadobacter chenwenxiniae]|uniref:SDR family oxidoreductase n=1 Tax=Dyadobacter chenwenxiniae TaxID=2906456 RepID=A0A9X1PKT5_9BACT|nr:SDR family oxidoreductase [Dyadobacter chenwenxiniae]MCF0060621.1 SDR family oxidoreductase [Dyadobacter chenwenxiniae]UON80453.1 SDR family oxidoreductase [Dyadobacter chenwenxiniae]